MVSRRRMISRACSCSRTSSARAGSHWGTASETPVSSGTTNTLRHCVVRTRSSGVRRDARADVHAVRTSEDDAGVDLDEFADAHGREKVDAARVHPDRVIGEVGLTHPPHRAGVGGFVDPAHHRPAVGFSPEVHDARRDEEPQCRAGSTRRIRVLLIKHEPLDFCTGVHAIERRVGELAVGARDRRPRRHGGGPAVGPFGHEDQHARGGGCVRAGADFCRRDRDDNVHARAPRVHHTGLHLDQTVGRNRTAMPHIADIRRDTVGAGPAHSARVACLVDPLHDTSRRNRTASGRGIGGGRQKPQHDAVIADGRAADGTDLGSRTHGHSLERDFEAGQVTPSGNCVAP